MDNTKMKNPFLGEKGDELWKKIMESPNRRRVTKEELLKMVQESKVKKLKG